MFWSFKNDVVPTWYLAVFWNQAVYTITALITWIMWYINSLHSVHFLSQTDLLHKVYISVSQQFYGNTHLCLWCVTLHKHIWPCYWHSRPPNRWIPDSNITWIDMKPITLWELHQYWSDVNPIWIIIWED